MDEGYFVTNLLGEVRVGAWDAPISTSMALAIQAPEV